MESTMEHSRLIALTGSGIVTPLGNDIGRVYDALCAGQTALAPHAGPYGPDGPVVMSRLSRPAIDAAFATAWPEAAHSDSTFFEKMALVALSNALRQPGALTVPRERTLLILSSTKGNTALLQDEEEGNERCAAAARLPLPATAQRIARIAGLDAMTPVVVSDACISGVAAQVLAQRLIATDICDAAVIVGADEQSAFIINGFRAFKALDDAPCRPFSADRCGLNPGEAAAAMVLQAVSPADLTHSRPWLLATGALTNDANHISGPSRTGEGSFRALGAVCPGGDDGTLAMLSLHGTATLYNDDMEAVAVHRAGLQEVPACSLKGTFGHTMGAAGVLETLLALHAAEKGEVPPTHGFATPGTPQTLRVAAERQHTLRDGDVIKLMSGFGGCNGAVRWTRRIPAATLAVVPRTLPTLVAERQVEIDSAKGVRVNGHHMTLVERGRDMLTEIYRQRQTAYPKFYKMDILCRLGFIAAELLMDGMSADDAADAAAGTLRTECAIVVGSHSGSIASDRQFQRTIAPDSFFPSPAVFVYTLPNIVTGEIAIRHHIVAETACYLLPQRDDEALARLARTACAEKAVRHVMALWLEAPDDAHFHASATLYHVGTH